MRKAKRFFKIALSFKGRGWDEITSLYPGRKGAFLSWGILKCPAGQEWAWGYHSSAAGLGCSLRLVLHPGSQGWEQPCPTGKGAASCLCQAQLHLTGLVTPGKISPFTLVTCLHSAITAILAQFGFFPWVSWSCCFVRNVASRQYLTSQENAVTSPQTSASAKEDFLLPWLKTAWIFSFFSSNKNIPPKYWSSLDLKTDDVAETWEESSGSPSLGSSCRVKTQQNQTLPNIP